MTEVQHSPRVATRCVVATIRGIVAMGKVAATVRVAASSLLMS
jgi:hypothetical protein